jgi:hypothetical protein
VNDRSNLLIAGNRFNPRKYWFLFVLMCLSIKIFVNHPEIILKFITRKVHHNPRRENTTAKDGSGRSSPAKT